MRQVSHNNPCIAHRLPMDPKRSPGRFLSFARETAK